MRDNMPNELAKALAAFHTNLPEVGKGSINPAFKSKYADLADIVKVVLPELAKNGLAWTTTPTMQDGEFVLAYRLMHTSGESLDGSWPLPDPTKATPQQLGSAVTYAKRYTLSAVTGIAPDEDDDGNHASAKGAPRAAARQEPAVDRVAKAEAAVRAVKDRAELDKIWEQVIKSGFHGIDVMVAAKADMDVKFPESGLVDHWKAAEVPS